MDFLNKAYTQLADLFRSLTVGARITTGLLLVAVVVSLGYLFQFHGAGADELLMGGEKFTPAELDTMEGAFAKANLYNAKRDNDNRLRVPRGQQSKYMGALVDQKALPNNAFRYLEEAVNNQSSFLDSADVRQRRTKVGMLRTISDVIAQMSGVAKANVLCDEEEQPGLKKGRIKRASVTVAMKGSESLDEERAANIRRMVANSLGAPYENVVVTDLTGNRQFWGDPKTGSGVDNALLRQTREYEKLYRDNLTTLLSDIKNVLLSVSVQLDPQEEQRVIEQKYDPKAVPVYTEENMVSKTQDGAGPGGIVGSASNTSQSVNQSRTASSKGSHNEEEKSERRERMLANSTQKSISMAAHALKKLSVAVKIPVSHFEKVWQAQNPSPAGEPPKKPTQAELDPIRQAVIAKVRKQIEPMVAVGDATGDLAKLIDVSDYQDIPGDPIPETPTSAKALEWLTGNWSTLALVGLSLVGMVMLRSMVRAPARSPIDAAVSAPRKAAPAAGVAGPTLAAMDDAPPATAAERRLKRLTGSGKSLRDELSEVVAEDPDLAANILRTWIGNVV